MFFQFQEHASEFIYTKLSFTGASTMEAPEYFHYLPPVGFLPLHEDTIRGIEIGNFFKRQPHRDWEFVSGEIVFLLINQALGYRPICASEKEMVWIYRLWQSVKGIYDGDNFRPFIIFTSAHMPCQAAACFDIARWDYSNYTRF